MTSYYFRHILSEDKVQCLFWQSRLEQYELIQNIENCATEVSSYKKSTLNPGSDRRVYDAGLSESPTL